MMTAMDDLFARYTGQTVPVSFNVGFAALSYVVSLLGAGSTLELINRRTSLKGLYNHFLLVGAAISMGGISIWSMHFIANRAIILLDGEPEVQIAYNTGITAASFFVPILVLLLAFITVNSSNEIKWWRVVFSGSLSGGAICGMHYLGDAAISNYHCVYTTANVVGAAAIAGVASTVALSLFFVFRAAWTNSWLRRAGCMVILAGAVSGMHWCASLGTDYVLLESAIGDTESGSRNTTTVVVVCLAAAASLILVVVAVLSARTMRGYAIKAQQVVLAVAVFDKHGRILVNPDGLLPSEKVTETFPQKSHDDVFTTAHPVFHWMYRASRNWSSISTLLPWMMTHLDSLHRTTRGARYGTRLFEENGQLVENHDIIFRELFCLAAETLASRMTENIQDIGRLWGEIFHTGTEANTAARMSEAFDVATRSTGKIDEMKDPGQLERGLHQRPDGYGRGSLMFLVRRIESQNEISRLEAAGYRFAETHRVIDIIKSSMQIKTRHLEEKLREMSGHSELDGMLEPGVHVGLFAVRARVDKFGFDVIVDAETRSTLPTRKLPYRKLEQWQKDILAQVEGLPIQTLLIRLAMIQEGSPRELEFASQLRSAVARLRGDIDDTTVDTAMLSSKVVEVPCLPLDNTQPTATCSLITLQVVLDINSKINKRKCDFIPLQFFKVHQMVHDNSAHHAAFSRALHRELSSIMTFDPSPQPTYKPVKRKLSHSSSTVNLTRPQDGHSSQSQSSGRASPVFDEPEPTKPSLFGGIMVSQEIAIEVAEAKPEKKDASLSSRLHLHQSRTKGILRKTSTKLRSVDTGGGKRSSTIEMSRVKTPTTAILNGTNFDYNVQAFEKDREVTTFVDELFVLCVESIRQ
ncbi:mhyt domain signaling [Seiridium cupressi]